MRNASTNQSPLIATAMALGLFALANAAVASDSNTQTKPAADPPLATATQDSGMRAYIDPATGKLREPTAEERQDEARASALRAQTVKGTGVEYKTAPNGAVRALDTEGRLMESVVATRNADGTLSYSYVSGDGSTTPPPAPVAEEK